MNKTYLLLGSNLGNSRQQLKKAVELITKEIGTMLRYSALYATAAWGDTQQPDFLNQVIVVGTPLDAQETLRKVLSIEKAMGRIRTVKNAPRIIDIDVLFFNKAIINEKLLVVPHPEIQHRRFVLIPLNEIAPQLTHPLLKKNIHQLLAECTDPLDVKKFY